MKRILVIDDEKTLVALCRIILENVGFEVEEGSVLGIVGESGCGKTVTALSMMGLLESEPGILGGDFYFKPHDKDVSELEQALTKRFKHEDDYRKGELLNLFYGLGKYVRFEQKPYTII